MDLDFTKLVVPPPFERAASTVTQTMTRKRPASVFDGVAPPTRKRKVGIFIWTARTNF
jgi:hypothetical protein